MQGMAQSCLKSLGFGSIPAAWLAFRQVGFEGFAFGGAQVLLPAGL
jgi:hypothetical protein